jgi:hypothetical protein
MLELLQMDFCRYRDAQYFLLLGIKNVALKLEEGTEEDEALTSIRAENLARILMKIDVADTQDDLKPAGVKMQGDRGTCSNYMFLPPLDVVEQNGEEHDGSTSDEDNNSSSDESENEESVPKKQKITELLSSRDGKRKVKYCSWQTILH